MNTLSTGRRGRLLALGITVLLLAAIWLGVVVPLLDWHAARAERLAQGGILALRMERVAGTLPHVRQEAEASGGAPLALLGGASDSIAGATLQGQVQRMASRAGVTLDSAELLAAEAAGRYRRISLRLSINGSWPGLVGLLQAMEEGTPRMLIDELRVHNAPSIAPGAGRPVSTSLTVVAFRAGGEAGAQ
ncbi:type II secretion system protein GspM [Roseomonas sp. GCM10028921]